MEYVKNMEYVFLILGMTKQINPLCAFSGHCSSPEVAETSDAN